MPVPAALVFAGKSVATPAISFLINKAFGYINEYFKSEDMDEVKNRLLLALPQIQAVFDVVNPEHVREQSGALDAWLWQLRDAVEAAEDAIDDLEYLELEEKAKDQKVSEWGSPLGKMKHKFAKSVKSVPVLNKTLKKITHRDTVKRLMKSVDGLDKAAAGVVSFLDLIDHLSGGSSSSQQHAHKLVDNDRQTGSTLSATKFVGREKEKEQITGWLVNKSVELAEIGVIKSDNIPIISVVGHGGMGKTTLAQSICEQDEILNHFQVIWVTVSTGFDATSVTRDLNEKLKSIKILLVLDDVWEDDKRDEWEKLFAPLRKLNTVGSKILLTTRMQSVADMAARVMGVKRDQCLTLHGLEDDETFELFIHHAFSGLNPGDYVNLKLLGGEISKKLRGCPLVTKVVGEHLRSNTAVAYWSRFLHQGLEHFKGTEEDIMKVLRLSYYHLPTELQICFRYCCIFGQGYKFQKKELVQLWIGSGLISQTLSDAHTLEDTAEQYLAQLTRKSFFDLKSRYDQEIYVMHGLMHELAKNVSTGECARIDDPIQLKDEKGTVRHLYINNIESFSVDEVKKFSHFMKLRTIIIKKVIITYTDWLVEDDIVCALEMIVESSRSLLLFHSNLRNNFHVADKFDNLKHLRYISLHKISQDTICGVAKLYHLMILHCLNGGLAETYELRYLGNLERLRYVSYGENGFGNFCISKLTFLQELHNYRVGGTKCNKISAVGDIRDLRELSVRGLENIESYEEAKNAKLKEKQHLSSLLLEWSTPDQILPDDSIIDHLEPHVNIKVLQISGYEGLKIPFWIENRSLKNLVSLKLKRCINWEYLPSLGELVLLKLLMLDNLPKLQQIGRSSDLSSSYSSMEFLLPQSLGTLEVINCPKLSELPILPPILKSLTVGDVGLTKLPSIGKISSQNIVSRSSKLTYISVTQCPCLTSLKGSLLEQKLYIGTLHVLRISDCIHLESASIPFKEMKELKEVRVMDCPNLRTMRDGKDKLVPLSLRELSIGGCGDLELPLLGSLQLPTNLTNLNLWNCSSLVSLPTGDVFKSLLSLKYMEIWKCENLLSLGGLGSLSSLVRLTIIGCRKLTEAAGSLLSRAASRSGGEEDHLVELLICHLIIDLPSLLLLEPLKSLCHTTQLSIRNGSEMESLPERWLLQNRTSLEYLRTIGPVKSLPPGMQDLSSLRKLFLDGAGQLQTLPYLPSSLLELNLQGCHPDLEKEIAKHGSPEWNKIAHIRRAQIGRCLFVMGKKYNPKASN